MNVNMKENYIKNIMNRQMLTQQEEIDLMVCWNKNHDEKSLKKLIESHLKLVVKIAYQFRHYGLHVADLIQEGTIGLIQAVKKYDPKHNARLSSYAKWWIKASIQEYIIRNWSIVRMGNTKAHKTLFFNLNRLKTKILMCEGEYLSNSDIQKLSNQLSLTKLEIANMEERLLNFDVSLNCNLSDESKDSFIDLIADETPTQEEMAYRKSLIKQQLVWIQDALETLTEQENYIIRQRYLSTATTPLSKIGTNLNLSKERIRQVESKAFRKMRHQLVYNQGVKKDDLYD